MEQTNNQHQTHGQAIKDLQWESSTQSIDYSPMAYLR